MKTNKITVMAVLIAIEIIFCFTPLGSIPLGPGITATLAHIPVIISAFILEAKYNWVLGAVMGLCSFIWWSTAGLAYPTSFVFTPIAEYGNFMSVVICFLPRILLPLFTFYLYDFFRKRFKLNLSAALSGTIATFLHSAMVLGLIYISFYKNKNVSENLGSNFLNFISAWAGVNALVEIATAGIVSAAVIKALKGLKSDKI
ncbi:ECF transporter S component [Porcipelethomonas sp.]|uniref:ECF transporter S component n=1 Tax=Porcipelethomonas sp. TaxID=2981675 RepID=UPI003EF672C0